MCYLAERGRYALKGVGINRREPQNRGARMAHPCGKGADDAWKYAHPHVLPAEFGCTRSPVCRSPFCRSVIKEIRLTK